LHRTSLYGYGADVVTAALLSFGGVFVAEFGDKSQLMAMTFALRHRWAVVIAGICTATAMVFTVSVLIGHYLGAALPSGLVSVVAGMAFIVVGLWSLRDEFAGGSHSVAPAARPGKSTTEAVAAVTTSFALAELGDKTMFVGIGLAANHNAFGVWLGSTLAMVIADGLAAAGGIVIGRHLPEHRIRIVAAFGFVYVGAWTLLSATTELPTPTVAGVAVTVPLSAVLVCLYRRRRRLHATVIDDVLAHHREPVAR
jgi:Ca2+/H+ antiporter, TMEM165/GDT1 family